MRRAVPRSRGASVLEVLIASGLLVTLLAIAVPNLRTLAAPWALSGATRQLVADLQGARLRAIARNVRYRVNFTSPHTYVLEREVSPGSFTADSAVLTLPATATLGTITPGNPLYDTRGMLAATVTVPVTVPAAGTRTITVDVLGQTTVS